MNLKSFYFYLDTTHYYFTGKSDTSKKDPIGSGEKRPAPDSKDGDESERKKAKTDAPATSASVATSGTGGTIVKLTGRSTRGSSSEKTTAPSSGKIRIVKM